MKRSERLTMTVTMQVTESQALALQAMFNYWNQLASMGGSRTVGFYVDGDGNFKPKCTITYDRQITELTPELAQAAIINDKRGDRIYDFDPIAWRIRQETEMIEPGEEIQCYVGMDGNVAAQDLQDKGVRVRVIGFGERVTMDYVDSRVNLAVDPFGVVERAYYG